MIDGRGRQVWERRLARDDGATIDDITVTSTGLLLVAGHGDAGTDFGGGVVLRQAHGAVGFVVAYPLRP